MPIRPAVHSVLSSFGVIVGVGCALWQSGCAGGQGLGGGRAEPLVRHHAEIDLDCPNEEVRVEERVGGKYVAIGCGRKAVYQTACDGLQCEVRGEDDPAIPWRDRPEP